MRELWTLLRGRSRATCNLLARRMQGCPASGRLPLLHLPEEVLQQHIMPLLDDAADRAALASASRALRRACSASVRSLRLSAAQAADAVLLAHPGRLLPFAGVTELRLEVDSGNNGFRCRRPPHCCVALSQGPQQSSRPGASLWLACDRRVSWHADQGGAQLAPCIPVACRPQRQTRPMLMRQRASGRRASCPPVGCCCAARRLCRDLLIAAAGQLPRLSHLHLDTRQAGCSSSQPADGQPRLPDGAYDDAAGGSLAAGMGSWAGHACSRTSDNLPRLPPLTPPPAPSRRYRPAANRGRAHARPDSADVAGQAAGTGACGRAGAHALAAGPPGPRARRHAARGDGPPGFAGPWQQQQQE